jgi:hypothetical protein
VEGLGEVRYYLQRIMLMVDKWVREEEARRVAAEPVVIDLVRVKT